MIPGLIIALVSMHLRLVLTKGINEYPTPGKPVRKATYDAEYAEIIRKEGVPFVPHAIGKDLIFAALVIVGILGAAFIFGPKGLADRPIQRWSIPILGPISISSRFSLLSRCCPIGWKCSFSLSLPPFALRCLLALPFISPTGEKSAFAVRLRYFRSSL